VTTREFSRKLLRAFAAPTLRQKEAYGRFAHTLAAAAVIGAITILFAEGAVIHAYLWRLAGLAISAVICFVGGVLAMEGE
jgi:hypothetical protein